jgi:chemosensory pili system protein ChpA (sensor histidine kinase/response regulator)
LVLLAEDCDELRELFALVLTLSGVPVETARDGREALQKAAALLPDVIVTDLRMPGLDGLEMTRQLKGSSRTSGIPVVLCTSEAAEGRARAAGCSAFLQKPCSTDALVNVVRSLRAAG